MSLESALADRASTDIRTDSAVREELEKRDRSLAEAASQIQQLETELAKERQNLKDIRAQVVINLFAVIYRTHDQYSIRAAADLRASKALRLLV